MGIGVLLIAVAVFIAIEVKAMLIGQSVDPATREAIQKFIEQRAEVKQVFKLITLQLGNDILVSVKVELTDPDAPTSANLQRINATERALKARFPDVMWSFFEPDDSA